MKKYIFALLAAFLLSFTSCGGTPPDPVDEYADLIDAADITLFACGGASAESISDLIESRHPEIVATAQVVSRGEPSDSMTPYDLTLTEVFVGNLKKGDSVTVLANYAAKNGKVISKSNSEQKAWRVGSEYLIFISEIGFEKGEFVGTYGNVTRYPGFIKISGEFDTSVFGGKYESAKELVKDVRKITKEIKV